MGSGKDKSDVVVPAGGLLGQKEPTPHGLAAVIHNFAQNVDGLRDFVDLVEPVLARSSKDLALKSADSLLPLVAAISLMSGGGDNASLMPVLSQEQLDSIRKDFDFVVKKEEGHTGVTIRAKGAMAARRFDDAIKKYFRRLHHPEHLYKTALVSLVSSVECFFSAILHSFYREHIEAVGTTDKQFSLKDLEAFKTITDAREAIIDNRVEGLLWSGFKDWIDHLRKNLKLTATYLDPVMDEMNEVFLRRNLIVHNDGVVNSIYLGKVAPLYANEVSNGQTLPVDRKYLDRAIDLFELNFMLLAAELWKKINKGDDDRSRVLTEISYQRMLAERWGVAGGISRFISEDKSLVEHFRLIGTVNYWQCMKWSGQFEEVAPAVKAADFSGKRSEFRLCLSALRDEAESFFEQLPAVLKAGELTQVDLREWPIFREMRKREEFAKFLSEEATKNADTFPSTSAGAIEKTTERLKLAVNPGTSQRRTRFVGRGRSKRNLKTAPKSLPIRPTGRLQGVRKRRRRVMDGPLGQ